MLFAVADDVLRYLNGALRIYCRGVKILLMKDEILGGIKGWKNGMKNEI
jgi:hypothetical protein